MKKYSYHITSEDEDIRVDKWISDSIEDLSRSYIQKLIKDNKVFINDKPCKSSYKLKCDDEISFEIPDAVVPDIVPEDIPLDILYEDEDVLIINKPKGMVVHPAPGHYTGTVVNAVMYHCKDSLSGINGVMRPGIVHRIDKDTTGSLIICKNDKAHENIAAQLKVHSIKRTYEAICLGTFSEHDFTVNKPIGRDESNRLKMGINDRNGKNAITHVHVLKDFKNHSYVECSLETGRTHQIRVHLSSINHPILGDDLYNNKKSLFKLDGQCLHAKKIGFIHPSTGKYVEFEAPLPLYFTELLNKL